MPENKNQSDEKVSLGLVPLPPGTFEHDVAVGDKYQKFSTELLRLSLAGIGAIGFVIVSSLLTAQSTNTAQWLVKNSTFGLWLVVSLLSFGVSAALALLHLYFSADSKAYHLRYLRLENALKDKSGIDEIKKRKDFFDGWELYCFGGKYDDNDDQRHVKKAADERDVRNFLLKTSGQSLLWSGILLWLGAMTLAFSFIPVIFK